MAKSVFRYVSFIGKNLVSYVYVAIFFAGFSIYAVEWNVDADGNWNTSGNWDTGVVPNNVTPVVFGSIITAPRTVTVDGNFTIPGVLSFTNDIAYSLVSAGSAPNTLTFDTSPSITFSGTANHSISANLAFSTTVTIDQSNATANPTISSVISGAGGLTKTGAGTLTLSGTNTYTGGTAINEGALSISSDSNFGDSSGAVSMTNSSLLNTGFVNGSRDFVITGTATIETQLDFNIGGVVSGTGQLIKTGGSTLNLFGVNNTHTGGTRINGGTCGINADNSLGDPSVSLILNNGGIAPLSSLTIPRDIVLIDSGGFTVQFDSELGGIISGNGILVKTGIGELTLTGANTYEGGMQAFAGDLSVSADNNLGDPSGPLSLRNATLRVTSSFTSNRNLSLVTSGGTIETQADYTLNGNITGVGPLVKTGSSTLTLSGTSTYTNGTNINAGTLSIDSDSSLGDASGDISLTSSTLAATGNFTTSRGISLSTSGTFDTSATMTANGVVSGTGQLIKTGSSSLVLGGVNTYSGGTALNGGTLSVAADNNLGDSSGNLTFNTGTLGVTSSFTTTRLMTLNTSGTISPSAEFTANGVISGTGQLIKAGVSTLVLGATNTYSGGTALNGGTLSVAADNNLGDSSGNLAFNTGTLGITSSFTTTRLISLTNSGVINTSADFTANGVISGTGQLVKTGSNALTLGGVNTHTGGTAINEGTCNVSADNNLGDSSGVLTFGTGTLNATSSFTASRNVVLNTTGTLTGSDLTLNGVISGSGQLVKNGSNALTLGGTNTYTGGTALNAGTCNVSADANLGDSSSALSLGAATLNINSSFTTSRNVALIGSGTINTASDLTVSGVVSGSSSFTKTGAGTLSLNQTNTFSGGCSLTAGVCSVGASNALGTGAVTFSGASLSSSADVTLDNALVLSVDTTINPSPTNTLSLNGVISGANALNITGAVSGTPVVNLRGTNTYSGLTTLTKVNCSILEESNLGAGNLSLDSANLHPQASISTTKAITLSDASFSIAPSFEVDDSLVFTLSGVLTGNGFSKIGEGQLIINADNSASLTGTINTNAGIITVNETASLEGAAINVASGATANGSGSFGAMTLSGGLISGNGTIASLTIDSGTISPGDSIGTLNITGNYTQSSGAIYDLEIVNTSSDKIIVGGTATIETGAILQIQPPVGTIASDTNYDILTATGGINQIWSVITSLSESEFEVTLVEGNTIARLTLLETTILAGRTASSGNPTRTLNYLQSIQAESPSDFFDVAEILEEFTGETFDQALNSLQPSIFSAFGLINLDTNALIARILDQQIEHLPCSNRTCFSYGDGENDHEIWFSSYGLLMRTDPIEELIGFRAKIGGLLGGYNYCFRENILLGTSLGFDVQDLKWDNKRGEADIDRIYGSFFVGGESIIKIATSITAGATLYDTKRHIEFPGLDRTAKSDHSGGFFSAHSALSYTLEDFFIFFSSFDYDFLYEARFEEKEANSLDLRVESYDTHFLRTELGLKMVKDVDFPDESCLHFLGGISWVYKTPLERIKRNAELADFIGQAPTLSVNAFQDSISFFSTELSLNYGVSFGNVSIGYKGEFSKDYMTNQADLQLSWTF